jgi:putative addiction module component (TIGR02574 family)
MDAIKVADLLHLSLGERLQLVGDLWDSIAAESEADAAALSLTPVQRDLIRRRSESHRSNPAAASSLDDALKRIDSALD